VNKLFSRLGSDLQLIRRSFAAPGVGNDIVPNLLAFGETTKASAFNGADMNENVFSAGFRLNESESPLRVEPFYSTGMHDMSFQRTSNWAPASCDAASIDILGRKSFAGTPRLAQVQKAFGRNSIVIT
jgi:hypothetical protein